MQSKGKIMKNKTEVSSISRRGFLKKLGNIGLAGSMLKLSLLGGNMLWAKSVFAAPAPKRFVFVYIPGGAIPEEWMPTGSGSNIVLPSMSSPLDSVKQHCVFLNGVNTDNPGHGFTSKVLGSSGSETLDTVLAQTLGQVTPFSHLRLGVISNGFGSMSRTRWREFSFEDSPFNAFERLFEGSTTPTENLTLRRKRSVLDTNLESLSQMNAALGSFEQTRLEEHTEAIRRIESRLLNTTQDDTSGNCTSPNFNSNGFNGATNTSVNFDAVANLQVDLATLALQCDLSRVVSIMFGNHQCDFTVPEAGVNTNYHNSIHGRPAQDYIDYRNYFTDKLRYLIQSLANIEDMDGNTLLDNTLILHVSDMGDARPHDGDNLPYLLAGAGGGVLTTGRVLDLNGVSCDSILDTYAQAAGIEVNGSGYTTYGDGPVDGIFNT
jgi:hypothetical protein